MDPMKQPTLEDHNKFVKPKKKPKLMIIKREALQFLLPLSVSYFILSYYFQSLPCYSSSINLSIAQLVDHYVNKKNLFLFSNIILFVLALDFSLRGLCGGGGGGGSSSPTLTIDLYEESLMSIAWHPPSESMNALAVVLQEEEEEEKKKGEIISMADKIYNGLFQHNDEDVYSVLFHQNDEDVVEEKSIILIESYVKERDKKVIGTTPTDGFFGDFLARIGDDMPWMASSIETEAELQIKAIREHVSTLQVVVVEDDRAKIEEEDEERKEIVRVKDERMELQELEELNEKFDEFIQRQKRIWQSESLQLVAVAE